MDDFFYDGPIEDASERIRTLSQCTLLAFDTETINLKDRSCIGVGICAGEHRWYFPTIEGDNPYSDLIRKLLNSKDVTKLFHNVEYDYNVLRQLGEVDLTNFEDTYLLARNMGWKAGLEYIGKNFLGYDDMFSIQDLFTEYGCNDMLGVPIDMVALKCMNDVRATYYAWLRLYPKANAGELYHYETDKDVLRLLRKVEKRGLNLSPDTVQQLNNSWSRIRANLELDADALGFNPASPKQVGQHIAEQGFVLPLNKSGRGLRTDEEALLEIVDECPEAKLVLDFRQAQYMLSHYLTRYIGEDRAYTHLRGDLATGRLASYGLEDCLHVCSNLQNVPPDMRAVFAPDSDTFTWMDFSQIELRIFAFLSGDPVMKEIYANNGDIHFETQSAIWPGSDRKNAGLRLAGKTANFSMIFNAQAKTILQSIKSNAYKFNTPTDIDYGGAARIRATWRNKFWVAAAYMEERMNDDSDYAETYFGRKMRLPDAVNPFQLKHRNICKINYPVQGTAADIIKKAMLLVDKAGLDMRLQVHDEMVFDGLVSDSVFDDLCLSSISSEFATPFEIKRGRVWS